MENLRQGDRALFTLPVLGGACLQHLLTNAKEQRYYTVPWPVADYDSCPTLVRPHASRCSSLFRQIEEDDRNQPSTTIGTSPGRTDDHEHKAWPPAIVSRKPEARDCQIETFGRPFGPGGAHFTRFTLNVQVEW